MNLAIIGGGPSGLMAAIAAKKELLELAEVHLFEKNDRVGKKILASGNGHCNFSNKLSAPSYYNHPEFVEKVFAISSPKDTHDFFHQLGMEQMTDEEGRMYPLSEMASSVLDVLRFECEHLGVIIHSETEISGVERRPNGFLLHSPKGHFFADVVIISTGGKAAPNLGTQGQAYGWIKNLGHQITETYPAIGPIKVSADSIRGLNGIRLNAVIKLQTNRKIIRTEKGEILFKENAISGIATFIISSLIARAWVKNKVNSFQLLIDCVPSFSSENLIQRLAQIKTDAGWKTLEQVLVGFLPKMVAITLLRGNDSINLNQPISELNTKNIEWMVGKMKSFELPVEDLLGWQFSQTTSGGVLISEIDANTLESKIQPHLFFSGEVIDIDGECGGFSLQWAWSSGLVAGLSAAKLMKKMVG